MPRIGRRYAWYIVGLLTAINFFNYVDRMVIVTMYDDLRARFGFTDDQLGAFWLAFFFVHAIATFPLGWASDRFDRRKIIGFGVIAWSLATLGSAYAWGFVSMLVLRGAVGIGEAAYGPPANALLCEVFPGRKAAVVGIFNGGMLLGACVGLAAGGLLGFPRAFQAVALPGLVIGLAALALQVPPERTQPADKARLGRMLLDGVRMLRIPTLRWMLPAGVLISFAAGGYTSWIVDFTIRYKGLTKLQAIPIYFVLIASAGISGVVIAGMVADRLHRIRPSGRALTMALGFFATVPFAIVVVFVDSLVPYFICGWLLNFFIPWYNGPMAAIIDDVVDDADAGTAQATFVPFLHLLGTGPAGLALGICSQYLSLRYAFLMPAAALLGAAICATVASRHVGADMAARAERSCARLAA
jgi:predicted MFS family arabinose efflux permease